MKLNILLFLLISFSHFSFSQEFGIKIGVVRSEIMLTDQKPFPMGGTLDNNLGAAIHPSISLFTNVISDQSFDIQAHLSYIHIGSSKTESMSYWNWNDDLSLPAKHADYTSNLAVQYIQFGISGQPKLSVDRTTIHLSIEPSVSYLTTISNLLLTGGKKDFVFGISGGVGIDLASLAGKNIFGEIKYYRDVVSFYENAFAKFWNTYIMISLGAKL